MPAHTVSTVSQVMPFLWTKISRKTRGSKLQCHGHFQRWRVVKSRADSQLTDKPVKALDACPHGDTGEDWRPFAHCGLALGLRPWPVQVKSTANHRSHHAAAWRKLLSS